MGWINIYPLDFEILSLLPLENKIEHHIDRFLGIFPDLKTNIITNHKIEGDGALEIRKNVQKNLVINFNQLQLKHISGESYVVSAYAEKLWQKSKISLTRFRIESSPNLQILFMSILFLAYLKRRDLTCTGNPSIHTATFDNLKEKVVFIGVSP